MAKTNVNGTPTIPVLGRGKPEGIAGPGAGEKISVKADAGIPRVARPGGPEYAGAADSAAAPKAARPGGPESLT